MKRLADLPPQLFFVGEGDDHSGLKRSWSKRGMNGDALTNAAEFQGNTLEGSCRSREVLECWSVGSGGGGVVSARWLQYLGDCCSSR